MCFLRTNEKERDTCIRIFIFSSPRVVERRLYRDEMEEVRRVTLKTTLEKLSRWYQFEKKQQEHRDKVKIGGSDYYQKEAN